MPRFNLGLFQKNFLSTSRVTGPAINMGCTRGKGSSTRMFNYCNQHSANSSECINQFITVTNGNDGVTPTPPTPPTPTFEVLGDGFDSDVYSIILNGTNQLYVGGAFTTNNSATTTFKRLATWDIGSETWSVVSNAGGGVGVVPGNVYSSVITLNNKLYSAGSFVYAPDPNDLSYVFLQYIGIYELYSSVWYALNGPGSAAGVNNTVFSVVYNFKNGYVYFGGSFLSAASGPLNYIASTDTNSLATNPPINQLIDASNIGLNGQVNQLSVDNNPTSPYYGRVYLCGNFTNNSSGSKQLKRVAVFDPTLGSSTDGTFAILGAVSGNGLNDGYGKSITVNPYSSNNIYASFARNGFIFCKINLELR